MTNEQLQLEENYYNDIIASFKPGMKIRQTIIAEQHLDPIGYEDGKIIYPRDIIETFYIDEVLERAINIRSVNDNSCGSIWYCNLKDYKHELLIDNEWKEIKYEI